MKAFIPSKLAEIVFALILFVFAYHYFKYAGTMSGVANFMPGDGKIWVYVSGAAFALAGIAIIVNVQKTLACYLLAALLLIFVFAIHLKGYMSSDGMKAEHMAGILKDTALAMCAILIGNRSGS